MAKSTYPASQGPVEKGQAGAVERPPDTGAALAAYRQIVDDCRDRLLACTWSRDELMRTRALYFLHSLEVSAFNLYVAPRQQFPALYVQAMFMPFELSWGIPNPDFLNHNGFIDGAHTYRIHGKMNGCPWATLQVFRGFWGDLEQGTLANIDFDDVPRDARGDFEIFLGPSRPLQASGKCFVELDPSARNIMLAMRETCWDWANETRMEVHIEILDRAADAQIHFDEREYCNRLKKAGKFYSASCQSILARSADYGPGGAGDNSFTLAADAAAAGGSPLGAWARMFYDIQADEALIIKMPIVDCRYWGIQLGSVWMQTTDFSYHQSSLNGSQITLDADGYFRVVLAAYDPGVPNWLDPAGLLFGMAVLRFYKFDTVAVPEVIKVKLHELRHFLPDDTPIVTPAQREVILEQRRAASLKRYGQ